MSYYTQRFAVQAAGDNWALAQIAYRIGSATQGGGGWDNGGLLTAGAGLLVSKLADDHRKKKQARGFVGTLPQRTQLAQLSPKEQRERALYRVVGRKTTDQ
jgi:hypothetical protein